LIGGFIYALFVFWVCGSLSVLIDIDHIFVLIGRKPPFKLSESYGRPLHNRAIFALVAIIISFFMATFIDGFYRNILLGSGTGNAILLLIGLNIATYYIVKKIGLRFGKRLREQRRVWRQEKTKNDMDLS